VLVEVTEEVLAFEDTTHDRENELADDNVERSTVSPGTLSR
jgi:hypothetical protein